MAKPNYQFEKRRRDLAKKTKQEEKRLRKLAGKTGADDKGLDAAAQPQAVVPADTGTAVTVRVGETESDS